MTTTIKTSNGSPRVVIHANANTGDIVITGNDSVSNVASFVGEVVNGCEITQIAWSAGAAGVWTVYRDAEVIGAFPESGHMNYYAYGLVASPNTAAANLTATMSGSTNGAITIEIKKT